MNAEPIPPQNLDAEAYVLGAIMVATPETVAAIRATGLVADDFYFRESHGTIYGAALDLAERGEPTDVLALEHELRSSGRLEQAGGKAKLIELAALVPATTNAPHHAGLVVEAARRREQVNVALDFQAVAMNGALPDDALRERVLRALEPRPSRSEEKVEFLAVEEFVARVESQAEPLAIDADGGTVLPATGLAMVYGTGGAGKTTLWLDAAMHLIAGDDWLGGRVRPVRRLRVGWIENEGPREEFRRKLERKHAAWRGRIKRGRLLVFDRPWSKFDLRRDDHRGALARMIAEQRIDLLIVGPLHRLGMEGGGTPDEVRAFTALIEAVQERCPRPLLFVVIHHDNRAGQVSGAWEGVPDLLVHVQGQGHGRLRVFFQKARWSAALHATGLNLTWAESESFAVEEKPELDDDEIGKRIVAAISDEPGIGWTKVAERTPGIRDTRRRDVRDRLLQAGKIVNVAKDETGERVALDYCPPRRATKLYVAADPTIRHLRPEPDADGTQIASDWGEGEELQLRPASRPKGTQEAGTQFVTPESTPTPLLGAEEDGS